jgi:hypothetical protein
MRDISVALEIQQRISELIITITLILILPNFVMSRVKNLPERSWPSRTMRIVLFIKPGADHAPRGARPTRLYTLTAPALFTALEG